MKVKRIQRLFLLLNKTFTQLRYSGIYILVMLCLWELVHIQNIHVDAYIDGATINFNKLSLQHLNSSSKSIKLPMSRNRTGKFLFDSLFGIDSQQLDAVDADFDDDDDDDDDEDTKPCKCGMPNPRFQFRDRRIHLCFVYRENWMRLRESRSSNRWWQTNRNQCK